MLERPINLTELIKDEDLEQLFTEYSILFKKSDSRKFNCYIFLKEADLVKLNIKIEFGLETIYTLF